MRPTINFNEQNFENLIVGFIKGTLREKFSRENFNESPTSYLSNSLNFSTIKVLCYTVYIRTSTIIVEFKASWLVSRVL